MGWHLVVSIALAVVFVPFVVAWGTWLAFALLALLPARKRIAHHSVAGAGARIDVLIPAHDEAVMLPGLLTSLGAQSAAGRARLGRMLVVADHCVDATTEAARAGGAEVLERASGPRGKPAALRDGLAELGRDGSGVDRAVLFLDADCIASPNLVEALATALDSGARVAQATDALTQDAAHSTVTAACRPAATIATLAFALKNFVRPRGMARVGVPTQLFGTGMCFRADVLARITFADHLAEDLAISHELLLAGDGALFVPEATVTSPVTMERGAMSTQKLRWETGQLQTWRRLPGMMARVLMRPGRCRNVAALLDWSAPPLVMGALVWSGIMVVAVGLTLLHVASVGAVAIGGAAGVLLVMYVIVGALQVVGVRGCVGLAAGAPAFVAWKIGLYMRMLTGRGAKGWERTPRMAAPRGDEAI